MGESAAKLFHCVVVMGAAMGSGCGSGALVASDAGADAAGASASSEGGGDAGTQAEAEACATSSAFELNAGCTNPGGCAGTQDAPRWPGDCEHPQDLICGIASSETGCRCIAGSPRVAADCPDPAQFTCDDWTMPCGCRCVTGAPTDASQCCPSLALDASTDASGASDSSDAAPAPAPICQTPWTCHSYDPPTGCECRIIPPPIL